MSRKMLINAHDPEESRIAVVEGGLLEEFYIERTSRETLVGNVYKGRVANVLPSLRAAFVDIGLKGKNGFLHASDVVGSIDRNGSGSQLEEEAIEDAADRKGREEPPIQKLLTVGQEVLVQVSRDGMGEKGPSLTMDISLPGRYLVITPRVRRVAVSKRIVEPDEREALRKLLEELDPPRNLGFIIRTAGAEKSVRDLKRDLDYLLRLWKAVVVRAQNTRAPAPVFQESDLVIRTIRDIFTTDIDEIIIDSFPVYNRTLEFFQAAMPRYQDHVKFYRDPEPLFYKYDVERQIDLIYQRTVPLPSGGSIVIDQTEALTAIDVNSGRFTRTNSPEEMAFRINMEAAEEVVRQLRLRDLGGQIIIDFIDLREEKNRASVEKVLRDAAKKDRSQTTILRMSRLGLVEMARQKVRPGVRVISYETCWQCQGTGFTKNVESMSLQVLRQLRQVLGSKEAAFVELKVHPEVANYLQNVKRRDLVALEDRHRKTVLIRGMASFRVSDAEFQCQDDARQPVKTDAASAAAPGTAGNEARKRESELRRSILAAAQESRLAAGHGGEEAVAAEPGAGAARPAALPVVATGETPREGASDGVRPADGRSRPGEPSGPGTTEEEAAARIAKGAEGAAASAELQPEAVRPAPARSEAAGEPPARAPLAPIPVRTDGPASMRPVPERGRRDGSGRPAAGARPGLGRAEGPIRPDMVPLREPPRPALRPADGAGVRGGAPPAPGTVSTPPAAALPASAGTAPGASEARPRRTYGQLMHPVSKSGLGGGRPAKPAVVPPARRPLGTPPPPAGSPPTPAAHEAPAAAAGRDAAEVGIVPRPADAPAPEPVAVELAAASAPAEQTPGEAGSNGGASIAPEAVSAEAAPGKKPARGGRTRAVKRAALPEDPAAGDKPARRTATRRKGPATPRKRKGGEGGGA